MLFDLYLLMSMTLQAEKACVEKVRHAPITRIPTPPIVEIPECPFHQAKDVTYMPPTACNVGAKPPVKRPEKEREKETVDKHQAPAENSGAVQRIFDKVLSVPITTN